MATDPQPSIHDTSPWYRGITGYQWSVLAIACLGWVFDCFEGQIFVASMNEAMPSLLPAGTPAEAVDYYNKIAFGAFLAGGALGGVAFGRIADRVGRKKAMTWTILFYSLFTCVSAVSRTWWQLAAFRFLVAIGVGGEWAVASALVAEVFPSRARAWSLAIFHASSVLGTFLAVAAGAFLIGNDGLGLSVDARWRTGFALGALPALLILWIRRSLKESEVWERSRAKDGPAGEGNSDGLRRLFGPRLLRHTLVGVGLAAVGLATFWGVHVYGKDRLKQAVEPGIRAEAAAVLLPGDETRREDIDAAIKARLKRWEMLGMFLVTIGGGLGLVAFGPLCERLGRRGAFLLFYLGGLISALALFRAIDSVGAILVFLPVFGFLTLGMHAGYAVYFPELYPTDLRSTGAGFCFNMARALAGPILILAGWMQRQGAYSLSDTCSLLSLLFLAGVVLLGFAPETKGRELPA